jgi:hypothetical protein
MLSLCDVPSIGKRKAENKVSPEGGLWLNSILI